MVVGDPTAQAQPREPRARPEVNETILTFAEQWLERILSGEKTLEIRPYRLQAKQWFAGHRGMVMGLLQLGEAFEVETDDQWQQLRSQHRIPTETRMYTRSKNWACPILQAARLEPFLYKIHRGAIGRVRYEPVEQLASGARGCGRPAPEAAHPPKQVGPVTLSLGSDPSRSMTWSVGVR